MSYTIEQQVTSFATGLLVGVALLTSANKRKQAKVFKDLEKKMNSPESVAEFARMEKEMEREILHEINCAKGKVNINSLAKDFSKELKEALS